MNASTTFYWDYETFDPDRMRDYGNMVLDKIFPEGNESKIAVRIDTSSIEGGFVDSSEILIFDSYVNALDTINKFEGTMDAAVIVYEVNRKGYAEIFRKDFDPYYYRLCQIEFQPYSLADVRWLFDTKASVYIVELETEEK